MILIGDVRFCGSAPTDAASRESQGQITTAMAMNREILFRRVRCFVMSLESEPSTVDPILIESPNGWRVKAAAAEAGDAAEAVG